MRQKRARVREEIARLRKYIDGSKNADPLSIRMAYMVETALVWSMDNTDGWELPLEEAKIISNHLRADLRSMTAHNLMRCLLKDVKEK